MIRPWSPALSVSLRAFRWELVPVNRWASLPDAKEVGSSPPQPGGEGRAWCLHKHVIVPENPPTPPLALVCIISDWGYLSVALSGVPSHQLWGTESTGHLTPASCRNLRSGAL